MKAIILGAGVVGITTAYELHKDGHDVTVIDRADKPAAFTSFANAGLFAPGHSYTWASPAAPGILLKSLWRNDQALRLRPNLNPAFLSWMRAFWRECSSDRAAINTARKARLCNYSQDVFHQTLRQTNVQFDGRKGGLLYLYRTQEVFDGANTKMKILTDNGVNLCTLTRDEIAKYDPALAPVVDELAGAILAPKDESGDCRMFCLGLAKWLESAGVNFRFAETINHLDSDGDRISSLVTDKNSYSPDIIVMCLGVYSPHLAKQIGVELPIYPVKGYSVTLPAGEQKNVPAIGGVDEENLVAYCPMGNRLRVTATAEFAGYGTSHSPADFRHMIAMTKNLFPDAVDYSKPDYWAGLRPMTPQGTPILGRGLHSNLWYNTGQGHMGWTMSHGAARITADLIGAKNPQIPLDGMLVSH